MKKIDQLWPIFRARLAPPLAAQVNFSMSRQDTEVSICCVRTMARQMGVKPSEVGVYCIYSANYCAILYMSYMIYM